MWTNLEWEIKSQYFLFLSVSVLKLTLEIFLLVFVSVPAHPSSATALPRQHIHENKIMAAM
jgi:hypothetical protein